MTQTYCGDGSINCIGGGEVCEFAVEQCLSDSCALKQKPKAQQKQGSFVLNYLRSNTDVDEHVIHRNMHRLTLRQIQKEAG